MSSLEDRIKEKRSAKFYSQHIECASEKEIGQIACAPTCFKMCLEYFKIKPKMSVLEMFKHGVLNNAKVGAGFKHDFIASEFGRVGLRVSRYDNYKKYINSDDALEKLKIELDFIDGIKNNLDDGGLVMNSEYMPRKSENPEIETRGSHFCIITHYSVDEYDDLNGFYINDPNFESEIEGKNRWYSLDDFLLNSRKLAIFINK